MKGLCGSQGFLSAILAALGLVLLLFAADQAETASAVENAGRPCAFPEALSSAGEETAARKAYAAVLERDPSSECASAGLSDLNATPSTFAGRVEAIFEGLLTFAAAAGLLLLLLFALLFLGYVRPIHNLFLHVPVVRRILGPRLTIESPKDEAVEGSPGAPIGARIKERLWRMREEASESAPEYDLDFGMPRERFADVVSENGGLRNSLSNATDISDQTRIIGALLNLAHSLLPISRFELSGALEPPDSRGAGVTLLLERNAKLATATTLRRGTSIGREASAPDFARLADPAAVWTQYEVARTLNHRNFDADAAESNALLREGLDFHRRGDLRHAKSSYQEAIQLDGGNFAAYVSLAVTEARLAKKFDLSIEKLEEGLAEMRAGAGNWRE